MVLKMQTWDPFKSCQKHAALTGDAGREAQVRGGGSTRQGEQYKTCGSKSTSWAGADWLAPFGSRAAPRETADLG